MTIKEITALRKSGRLEEALKAAEQEFSLNANIYTVGALFWCLNDLIKRQSGEEANNTYERMNDLYEEFCQDDELMIKALKVAKVRLAPNREKIQNAISKAKDGDTVAYREIEELYKSEELDNSLYPDFGWLIYYTLKHTQLADALTRKRLLARYLELNVERPSILHSLILAEAVKVEQNTPLQFRIRDFVKLWNLDNLRDDDWEQFRTNVGNTLPSLVEKLIGVYAKELKTDKVKPSEEFVNLLDKAVIKFTNNQNIPYFKATTLIAQGKNEEAIKYYKDLILRFPAKFYLWDQVANLVDDIDLKIGLLCKAVNTGEDEGFIGGARLRLANALISNGLYANAKTELDKYRSTYESNGWNLKTGFWEIMAKIPADTTDSDNKPLYLEYFPFADNFIYSELPTIFLVKVSDSLLEERNKPGRKFVQWTLRNDKHVHRLKKPRRFGLDNKVKNGSIFEAKIKDDKIVWIKPSKSIPSLDWLKTVKGSVSIRQDKRGKPYSIVDGVYVGEKLIKGLKDGDIITIIAIRQEDGRWSAISKYQK